tara:strand:- start:1137 stop:1325 length:189 start_codon:yes stop_codon:yes gene_type:complete
LSYKIGDLVRIIWNRDETWGDNQLGLVLELTKRLYIPAANILVLGEVAQFDLCELEAIDETR